MGLKLFSSFRKGSKNKEKDNKENKKISENENKKEKEIKKPTRFETSGVFERLTRRNTKADDTVSKNEKEKTTKNTPKKQPVTKTSWGPGNNKEKEKETSKKKGPLDRLTSKFKFTKTAPPSLPDNKEKSINSELSDRKVTPLVSIPGTSTVYTGSNTGTSEHGRTMPPKTRTPPKMESGETGTTSYPPGSLPIVTPHKMGNNLLDKKQFTSETSTRILKSSPTTKSPNKDLVSYNQRRPSPIKNNINEEKKR